MSRVKGKDTSIERKLRSEIHGLGLRYRKHAKGLPGKPDIVFVRAKVVVFVDGDFWHGYRYPLWKHKISQFWQKKIETTRKRDQRNFRKLRRMGWKVVRIWEHTIEDDPNRAVSTVLKNVPKS
jgi:DNA mismatch endonuclease, patch repair protein